MNQDLKIKVTQWFPKASNPTLTFADLYIWLSVSKPHDPIDSLKAFAFWFPAFGAEQVSGWCGHLTDVFGGGFFFTSFLQLQDGWPPKRVHHCLPQVEASLPNSLHFFHLTRDFSSQMQKLPHCVVGGGALLHVSGKAQRLKLGGLFLGGSCSQTTCRTPTSSYGWSMMLASARVSCKGLKGFFIPHHFYMS